MNDSLGAQLGFGPAQAVTTSDGMVRFVVTNQDEPLSSAFYNWILRAPQRALVRMIGGTSIPDADNKRALIELFETVAARRQFRGAFMSGGTRIVDADFAVDPMIVEIPSVFKRHNPECIALGTAPRTAKYMTYRGEHSSLYLNDDATTNVLPNPDLDCLMVVQLNSTDVLDWDGDVPTYIGIERAARDFARFSVGNMIWNGGGVSATEVRLSLDARFPTLVIEGSGRIADGLVACRQILLDGGTASDFPDSAASLRDWLTADAAFDVVGMDQPDQLENWMDLHNLLVPA